MALTTRANPYVGPRSFATGETLYGRERETQKLLNLLIAERIVLFHSPSGAGKTSLIQAALVPQLADEGFAVLPIIRVGVEPPTISSQFSETTQNSTLNTQHSTFNRYVFSALLSLEEGMPAERQLSLEQLAGILLSDYLTRREAALTENDSLVLIFDQFEEVLTSDPTDPAAKQAFFHQLGMALHDRKRWALFAMREDYLAPLAPYLRPVPTRLGTTFRLDLLEAQAARQAMQQPARRAGVEFTDAAARTLADDLRRVQVQRPDGTMEQQLGLFIEPVQLQVVCNRLWSQLPDDDPEIGVDDIEVVGDVDSALTAYYAERVAATAQSTGVPERAIRNWFDFQLITEQGIRGQVLHEAGQSGGLENRAIWPLIDAHLVRGEKRRGATWFELAHDRLIEPLRKGNAAWRAEHLSGLQRQAATWERQGRPSRLLLHGQDLADSEQWAVGHAEALTSIDQEFLDASQETRRNLEQAEQASRSRRRARVFAIVSGVILILLLISVIAFVLAFMARNQAVYLARIRTAQNLATEAGVQLDINPRRSLLLALEALSIHRELGERPGPDAEDNLRRALVNSGGLVLQGHQKTIGAVAFSPDSRWLVTGSEDSTARLWNLSASDPSAAARLLNGHTGAINALAFSPDRHWLATGDSKGALWLWDLSASDPSAAVEVLSDSPGSIGAVGFSSDGHWLAIVQNRAAQLWDLADLSAEPYTLSGHTDQVTVLAFSPDSHWLATGGADATAYLWDLTAQNPAATSLGVHGHAEPISAITFTPNSQRLITASSDTTAQVWDIPISGTDATPIVLRGHNDQIFALAISADSRWLVTASRDSTARVWDLDSADPTAVVTILRSHEGEIRSVAISADNRWIATGSRDSTARLWRLTGRDSPVAPWVLRGHTGAVRALAFSRDGRWLATGSGDSTARLWNLQAPSAEPIVVRGHANALRALAISNDNHWLVTASSDGINTNVRLWDLSARDPSRSLIFLRGHSSGVRAAVFSPDSRWLATADQEGGVRLWRMGPGNPSTAGIVLPGHTRQVRVVAFSEDSRWLATGGDDSTVRLWDVSGQNPATASLELGGHSGAIRALAFSYDNRWLVSGGDDGTPMLWDLKAQNPATTPLELRGHSGGVRTAAFSRDGRWLVTGSSDNTARLWNMSVISPTDQFILVGHIDEIRALAISEDSHWLLTGSEDGDARLWDLTAADPDAGSSVLSGHTGPVWAVAISPDGRWMATGSQDGTARLWTQTTLDTAEKLACRIAGRNLSQLEWDQYVRDTEYYRTCSEFPSGQNMPADAPAAP